MNDDDLDKPQLIISEVSLDFLAAPDFIETSFAEYKERTEQKINRLEEEN